jgi:hypothetical protein
MEQMDHTAAPGCYSLRRILVETGATLDMIRARVAHQAFAGGPPEAFWPPMRALLDRFFCPGLGEVVCDGLDMDRAYEAFWEPETRALMRDLGRWQDTPKDERVQAAGAQGIAVGTQHRMTQCDERVQAARQALRQRLQECAQELVARRGPAAITIKGRFRLHYQALDRRGCSDPPAVSFSEYETYYPLKAVLAALGDVDLYVLQDDWNEGLGHLGPLPIHLRPTADGNYCAMMAQSIILHYLTGYANVDEDVQREN